MSRDHFVRPDDEEPPAVPEARWHRISRRVTELLFAKKRPEFQIYRGNEGGATVNDPRYEGLFDQHVGEHPDPPYSPDDEPSPPLDD